MIANEVIYCIKKGGQEVWFTSITIVVWHCSWRTESSFSKGFGSTILSGYWVWKWSVNQSPPIYRPHFGYSFLVNVKRILRWFKLTSGLKVNFHKSSFVGINLDEDYTAGMTNVIYCKWDTLPSDTGDYLWVQIRREFQLGSRLLINSPH
jgi:hypothetical protein